MAESGGGGQCALAEPNFEVTLSASLFRVNGYLGRMSLRLTRTIRVMAGWLVALAYLLCVLGPGVALALGSGPAPCLAEELSPVSLAPAQDQPVPIMSMHAGGSSHDHGAHHAHHHAGLHHAGMEGGPAGHHHKGNALPGPCCAMMCVSAIPANLPAISAPSQPVSICVLETDRGAPGNAPPLLYRPPIA